MWPRYATARPGHVCMPCLTRREGTTEEKRNPHFRPASQLLDRLAAGRHQNTDGEHVVVVTWRRIHVGELRWVDQASTRLTLASERASIGGGPGASCHVMYTSFFLSFSFSRPKLLISRGMQKSKVCTEDAIWVPVDWLFLHVCPRSSLSMDKCSVNLLLPRLLQIAYFSPFLCTC